MKGLRKFMSFDFDSFAKGMTFAYMGGKVVENVDFHGVSMEIVILYDPNGINDFEKLHVKVPGADAQYLASFTKKEKVTIRDITKATVYGDYQNELSITGKVYKVVQQTQKQA